MKETICMVLFFMTVLPTFELTNELQAHGRMPKAIKKAGEKAVYDRSGAASLKFRYSLS